MELKPDLASLYVMRSLLPPNPPQYTVHQAYNWYLFRLGFAAHSHRVIQDSSTQVNEQPRLVFSLQ